MGAENTCFWTEFYQPCLVHQGPANSPLELHSKQFSGFIGGPKKKKKERESSNTTECIIKNNQREFKVKIILLFLGSAVKISFTLYTVRFNFIFRDLSFLRQNFNLHDILCLRKLRSQEIKLNLIRTSFLQLNPFF